MDGGSRMSGTPVAGTVVVWRRWFSPGDAEAWVARWRNRYGRRLTVTQEAHRSAVRVDVYPRGEAAAARMKSEFGGRVVHLKPDVWWRPQLPRATAIRAGRVVVTATKDMAARWRRRHPGLAVIWIPAGLAFGTGQHGTTRSCLRALNEAWPFASLLDAGCGTGILAIAGAKLGATGVEAFDNDPAAVKATRENARRNDVRVRVRRMDLASLGAGHFEIIVANILSGPLAAHARRLCRAAKPGGRLILSGIRPNQEEEVLEAFAGCRLMAHHRSEGWSCLVLRTERSPRRARR